MGFAQNETRSCETAPSEGQTVAGIDDAAASVRGSYSCCCTPSDIFGAPLMIEAAMIGESGNGRTGQFFQHSRVCWSIV
jgi:hypothetical protein